MYKKRFARKQDSLLGALKAIQDLDDIEADTGVMKPEL